MLENTPGTMGMVGNVSITGKLGVGIGQAAVASH
jgi:hypothetical protein